MAFGCVILEGRLQMKTKHSLGVAALILAASSFSHAAVFDTFNWTTPFSPPQGATGTGTIVAPDTVTGVGSSYLLQRIVLSGSITEINGTTNDFISDNRVLIEFPSGPTYNVALSSVGGYSGTTNFTGSFFPSSPLASPFSGTPTFRFVNTFDDSPTGQPDARINNLTIAFRDDLPAPTGPITDLGVIKDQTPVYATPDYAIPVTVNATDRVTWVKFTLENAMFGSAARFLDIDISGPTGGDTVIGLYRAFGAGVLEDSDDDDGIGNPGYSALSYGQATPARGPIGDGLAGNGRDGTSLGAGDYYLAIANWSSSFNFGAGYNVTGVGTPAAPTTYTVNIRTNVPEPTALSALVAAGLLTLRRRR
jgi:hypothetical protein